MITQMPISGRNYGAEVPETPQGDRLLRVLAKNVYMILIKLY